jgi:diaphanous 1
MRYMSPPENLVTQLDLYVEEKQEDLEDLRYQTLGHQSDDSLDFSLGQLAKLAQEHSELYPVLVDTVKRYVLILERDIDKYVSAVFAQDSCLARKLTSAVFATL